MLEYDKHAANQVIWFTDTPPTGNPFDQTPMALDVMDEWMANIQAHPERDVGKNKPDAAVDSCFDASGALISSGKDVWDGILDDKPAGACTSALPDLLDVAHPVRRPDDRRHLRVPPPAGRGGDRARRLRAVAAVVGRGRAASGDLPDRRLRLQKGDVGRPKHLK